MLRKRDNPQEEKLRTYLRNQRKKMGLSQVELSEMCELPQSFVSKYETGERYLTFIEVLMICKLLKINILDLSREVES
ncbi:helix-turn-helix transcriptional regulator [Akkermansia muciniphila]|uniref:helix-turn-helix domain-containing protein n=1 Tax=Akkermansia muciniphila TaxID=239935 RepID=UPI0033B21F67